jgi:hypothetical protein
MNLPDGQVSRLRAALDKQLEADKQFEAKSKAILDPPSSTPSSRLEAPSAGLPPLVAQVFEDQYAKAWGDAWDFFRPQLLELHRRVILTGTRLSSANRWVKWLPIICFCCTLFGFVLGWCCATFSASRPQNGLEIIPKFVGDRSDKIMR